MGNIISILQEIFMLKEKIIVLKLVFLILEKQNLQLKNLKEISIKHLKS